MKISLERYKEPQGSIHTFSSRKWGARDVLEWGIFVIRLAYKDYNAGTWGGFARDETSGTVQRGNG